jgi:hypothetical protein
VNTPETGRPFSVVWRYTIFPETIQAFEREYGPEGAWAELFGRSRDYRGSVLLRSTEPPLTYLLIDTWSDRASYEAFLAVHRAEYDALSARCARLYRAEERIGAGAPPG